MGICTAATPGPSCSTLLIDDLACGNGALPMNCGRLGFWYIGSDGTGTQVPYPFTPTIGGEGSSMYAAHTYGHGFTQWGSAMGLNLNHQPLGTPPQGCTYDASSYSGIQFYAKMGVGNVPNPTPVIYVNFLDEYVIRGFGICSSCGDVYYSTVTLSDTWTLYTVPYSILHNRGTGQPLEAALDVKHLVQIEFAVAGPTLTGAPGPVQFDYWISNVSFVP
jgi:hypothetical protein